MNRIFFLFTILFANSFIAQVGINTMKSDPSALLEIGNLRKTGGLLLPRVSLNSKSDITTVTNPSVGLMVYNIADGGVGVNRVFANYLYIFNGTIWQKLSNRDDLATSEDLPYVVAFGRKETITDCVQSDEFRLEPALISDTNILSTSGEFTAPKNGYYSFSVSWEVSMNANASQSFEVSPYFYSEGLTTLSTRFRNGTNSLQLRTITGTTYLTLGQKTKPFYWSMGSNTCNSLNKVRSQQIVWEYVGNPQ